MLVMRLHDNALVIWVREYTLWDSSVIIVLVKVILSLFDIRGDGK